MIKFLLTTLSLISLLVQSQPLSAQTEHAHYPERSIRLVIPYPPGGSNDNIARLLATQLQKQLGQSIVIENRAGASGTIGSEIVAKAPADGYTLLFNASSQVFMPLVVAKPPYDTLKDFEAVGLLGDLPFVLVCNPSLPVTNVKELIAYAKSHPDQLNNASSGNGTVSHLAMEELKRKAGLKITHIPYKGSVAGLTDVISGNVSMALETASAVKTHVESGRLRAIAAGSAKRLSGVFAQVPTLIEQGFADFTATTWLMALYPAGTPKATVNATYSALSQLAGNSEFEQKLLSLGLLPRHSKSPEEAANYLRSEFINWGEIVKRSGLEKEV